MNNNRHRALKRRRQRGDRQRGNIPSVTGMPPAFALISVQKTT
jgi:hypothetical protein